MADTILSFFIEAATVFAIWGLLSPLVIPPRELPKVRR